MLKLRKMNKRGVEPITVGIIIISIIAGLFLAQQAGLFSISTDPALIKDTTLTSSINRYFYDNIIADNTNWECVKQYSVKFRTSDLNYGSGQIEYTDGSCGGTLKVWNRGGGASVSHCTTSYGTPVLTNLKKSWAVGALTFNSHSGGGDGILDLYISGQNLVVCEDDADGTGGIAGFYLPTTTTTSSLSVDLSREEGCGDAPIKDAGKVTCENGDVVLKFCKYNGATVFTSTLQDDCSSSPSLPCEHVQRTISGVTKDVVKCGGDYKPGLSICSSPGNTMQLFTTNTLGFLTTTTCGVNNYSFCSPTDSTNALKTGTCAVCKHQTSWCDGTKVMSCSNNVISNPDTCSQTGFSCIQTGNAPDTTAACSSSIPDGNKICSGNQQLIYSLSQRKYNNGTLCRTSCSAGECTNEALCTSTTSVKCSVGAVYKCDVSAAGNQWKYYYNNVLADSTCLSGQCNADAITCKIRSTPIQYTLGYEYCSSTNTKQRQKIVADTSGNLLTGGTIIADITGGLCTNTCVWNNATHVTSCQALSQCIGNSGLKVCNGNKLQQCDATGESITSDVDCTSTSVFASGRGVCDTTTNPKSCKETAGVCDGSFTCRDSQNIWGCSYGNWLGTTPQHTCEYGCSGVLSATSNCNNQAGCTSGGTKCVNGTRYDCTAKTVTGTTLNYYVKSNSFNCPTNTCNTAGTACSGQCVANTNACRVGTGFNQIYTCTADGLWPTTAASDTCSGKGCSLTTTDTPTLTNSQCTNDCDSSKKGCSGSVLKTCSERTGVLDQDSKQWIFDTTKDVSCIAGCANSACTPQKTFTGNYCNGLNDLMNSYTDAANIAGGGISTKLVATCTAGCQGTNGAASCKPIMALGRYCTGAEGKVVNNVITDTTAIADGGVKIVQNVETCQLSCSSGVCATNCKGTSECSATDGKVHYCSGAGVLGAVTINCSSGCSEVNDEGKCNPLKPVGLYCKDGTNLWEAYVNANAPADGGVSLRSITTCNQLNSVGGCTSGPPATCSPVHTLGYYCGGTEGKVLMQAVSNTASNNLPNGYVTINTIRTCGLSCRQNTTTNPTTASCETNCDGATECSNGVVKICDANHELGGTSLQCAGGCSEVNAEGKCSPIHTLGKFCGTGVNANKLMEAVSDVNAVLDGGVKINTVATCLAGCTSTTDGAVCARYKQPGQYCEGTKLMVASVDPLNSQASIPYGGIITALVKQCPASCNQITTSAPTQAECILDCAPGQTIACRPNGVWSCTTSGLYDRLIDDCKDSQGIVMGCSDVTNRCKDECPVKTIDMCKNGDAYRCLATVKDYVNITSLLLVKQEDCTSGCEAGACIKQCTGDISCYPVTGNLHSCSNGIRGDAAVVCQNGCDQTTNQCKNECDTPDKTECSGVNSRTCKKNVTTVNGREYFQYLWQNTPCGNAGCDPNTQLCSTECTPGKDKCAGDGNIHSCTSDAKLSVAPINTCNGLGCDTTSNACKQQCNGLSFRCANDNQIECFKNDTTQQFLERATVCGQLGCDVGNGKCKGSVYKNSFDCAGVNQREIFKTDGDGKLIGTSLFNCVKDVIPAVNKLNPYCQPNVGVCTFCESDKYYCIDKELFQCDNPTAGTRKNILTCDAGCNADGSVYCDDAKVSFGQSNFGTDATSEKGDINLQVTLSGSNSNNAISDASIDATLTGTETDSKTGFIGQNGVYNIQFLQKSKGAYKVTLTINGYTKLKSGNDVLNTNVINKDVYITDTFIIAPYSDRIITLVPGVTPKLQIRVENENTHATPKDVVVSTNPANVTIEKPIQSNTDKRIWEAVVTNPTPGQYAVGFKTAQQSGVLDTMEGTVDFEIVKPALKSTINNPKSTTLGKHEYQLSVTGPAFSTGSVKTVGIDPDVAPKVTISYNGGAAVSLTPSTQGSGKYLLVADFTNAGTYTITAEATKTGYDKGVYSDLIQVSSSGTSAPPATDGSGNTEVVTSTGGVAGAATGGATGGSGGGTTMYIIIGIAAVAAYIIYSRRKR